MYLYCLYNAPRYIFYKTIVQENRSGTNENLISFPYQGEIIQYMTIINRIYFVHQNIDFYIFIFCLLPSHEMITILFNELYKILT